MYLNLRDVFEIAIQLQNTDYFSEGNINKIQNTRNVFQMCDSVTSKRSFHSIHNVVDRGVLQAMWEEHAGKVGHRDQLIIC